VVWNHGPKQATTTIHTPASTGVAVVRVAIFLCITDIPDINLGTFLSLPKVVVWWTVFGAIPAQIARRGFAILTSGFIDFPQSLRKTFIRSSLSFLNVDLSNLYCLQRADKCARFEALLANKCTKTWPVLIKQHSGSCTATMNRNEPIKVIWVESQARDFENMHASNISRDISIGIAMKYGLNDRGSISNWSEICFFSPQNCSSPSFLSNE
jgi:hypothetical protein